MLILEGECAAEYLLIHPSLVIQIPAFVYKINETIVNCE